MKKKNVSIRLAKTGNYAGMIGVSLLALEDIHNG